MKIGSTFKRDTRIGNPRHSQQGYMLIAILLVLTLLVIAMAAIAPSIVGQIKRDREEELVHRGAQYARAIKKYYKKTGRYPMRVEDLLSTNRLRFLRQQYKDPITGKDFRLLHFGEVILSPKAPGTSTGPGIPAASLSVMQGASRSGSSSTGTGPSFGGGPIIGVASTSDKESFKVFNDKNHYKDWEFLYDPSTDLGALITGPYNGVLAFTPIVQPGAGHSGGTGIPGMGGTGGLPGGFGMPTNSPIPSPKR